jgi:hypothetical protein
MLSLIVRAGCNPIPTNECLGLLSDPRGSRLSAAGPHLTYENCRIKTNQGTPMGCKRYQLFLAFIILDRRSFGLRSVKSNVQLANHTFLTSRELSKQLGLVKHIF